MPAAGGSLAVWGVGCAGVLPAGNARRGVQATEKRVLRTDELDYELPESAIATVPADPRDGAKLLVTGRAGSAISHRGVRELPEILRAGDLLVFNTTRVLHARFEGVRADTGGRVEGLYLSDGSRAGTWRVLLRGKRMKPGIDVALPHGVTLRLLEADGAEMGAWIVEPSDVRPAAVVLEEAGLTPLPPYILKARRHAGVEVDDRVDERRYQTVYAREDQAGSVAAPTAGLHFTPELLARLAEKGIERADVTLHVGTGTFRPVEADVVEQHPMHVERCSMSHEAIDAVRRARADGRRVIAVGTTTARTLESYAMAMESGGEMPASLDTRILITPGYAWRWVDGLFTNFHLPRSTLMAMVASLLDAGVPRLRGIYAEALAHGYRFYSYGDAMIVLP